MDKIANYRKNIYKIALDRDSDTKTRTWRDRISPEINRKARRLPAELITDLTIGTVVGKYGAKAGGKLGKVIGNNKKVRRMSSKALKGIGKLPLASKTKGVASKTYNEIATKLKNNPVKETRELGDKMIGLKNSKNKTEIAGKAIGGAIAGGVAGMPVKYYLRGKQETKDYDKLSHKYLGRGINEKEKQALRTRNKKITLGYGSPLESFKSTPEAMIQKARREKK